MVMKASLQLKLGQSLTMTPQLQQAIRLLQLSTLDLQQEIQQALESNPMLETSEDDDQTDAASENDEMNPRTARTGPRRTRFLTTFRTICRLIPPGTTSTSPHQRRQPATTTKTITISKPVIPRPKRFRITWNGSSI